MNEMLMNKASFPGVCRILEGREAGDAFRQSVLPMVKLFALLIPGFSEIANFTDNLDAVVTILDAGEYFIDAKEKIKMALGVPEADYIKSANNASIAYVLSAYAAFFDAANAAAREADLRIPIDGYAKAAITGKAARELKRLCESQELPLPGPTEAPERNDTALLELYRLMRDAFERYLEGLQDYCNLSRDLRERLDNHLEVLPKHALERYRSMYIELCVKYPHFEKWCREHDRKNDAIKQEYEHRLTREVCLSIPVNIRNHDAAQTLQYLHQHNVGIINEPLLNSSEISIDNLSISFPSRRDMFVPQSFSFLPGQRVSRLEENSDWKRGADLISFIDTAIHHQTITKAPLLILGGPGAGKTMLSQMLAGAYLCGEYHVHVIHLRDLGAEQKHCKRIHEQINYSLGSLPMRGDWDQLLRAQIRTPVLLIFDGFDELLLASSEVQKRYLEDIANFQRMSPLIVHTIVTSRMTLIDQAAIRIPEGTTVIRLDGFDEPDGNGADSGDSGIDVWTKKWNDLVQPERELSIPKSGNVAELAKQPLLLLMLALYDAMAPEKTLHDVQDLEKTALYDQLIQKFIEREEKKQNENFSEELSEGKSMIEDEMLRLGVTALGMYNRKQVHIRTNQLAADLQSLKIPKRWDDREDGQRLLRRFFFIHHIESKKSNNLKFGAYEFLHNSFGEFLTAHYIVNCLKERMMCSHEAMEPCAEEIRRKRWYAGMSYVPLYTRPNIAEMLRNWSKSELAGYEKELEAWIYGELRRVLHADVLEDLRSASGDFDQPAEDAEDLMYALVVYACNLMSVGALTMGSVELDRMEPSPYGIWRRFLRLWQIGFDDKEMVEFARIFRKENVDQYGTQSVFVYKNDLGSAEDRWNREEDLQEQYTLLDMEPERSLLAAVSGEYRTVQKKNGASTIRAMRLGESMDKVSEWQWLDPGILGLRGVHKQLAESDSSKSLQNIAHLMRNYSGFFMRDRGVVTGTFLLLKQYAQMQPKTSQSTLGAYRSEIWETFLGSNSPFLQRLAADLLMMFPSQTISKCIESIDWYEGITAEYYHDLVRLTERAIIDKQCNSEKLIRKVLYMGAKQGVEVDIDTLPYLLRFLRRLCDGGVDFDSIFTATMDACIRAMGKYLSQCSKLDRPAFIADVFCVLWHPKWRVKALYLSQVWKAAKNHVVEMAQVYRACPDAVGQMCLADIAYDEHLLMFRSQRIKELLNQCPEDLQLKHLRAIRKIADDQRDMELAEKVNRIMLM